MADSLKALLFSEDIISSPESLDRAGSGYTVQHLAYELSRSRTSYGRSFGETVSTPLSAEIRLMNGDNIKVFYECLKSNSRHPFTFVFNPKFDSNRRLSSYESAFSCEGYILGVVERFDTFRRIDGESDQILVGVRMIITSIIFSDHNAKCKMIFANTE